VELPVNHEAHCDPRGGAANRISLPGRLSLPVERGQALGPGSIAPTTGLFAVVSSRAYLRQDSE
jgi:hypothetical protein